MSESSLLQFCYQCNLGSLETTFETMQNRVQWNFEAFLEDLRKKNSLQGQNDNEFQGYIWPFLSAENIWQPNYASNHGRKRIFNMNQSNSEEIWLNWIMNQGTGDIKSPPRLNGSNCSTCFIGNLEMFDRQVDISFCQHGDSSINSLASFCYIVLMPKYNGLLTFYISVYQLASRFKI